MFCILSQYVIYLIQTFAVWGSVGGSCSLGMFSCQWDDCWCSGSSCLYVFRHITISFVYFCMLRLASWGSRLAEGSCTAANDDAVAAADADVDAAVAAADRKGWTEHNRSEYCWQTPNHNTISDVKCMVTQKKWPQDILVSYHCCTLDACRITQQPAIACWIKKRSL